MATSSKVHLSPSQQPVFYVPGIRSETADMTSELLQENHEKHHIFFNYAGFYNNNVSYQRPPYKMYLGSEEYYHNFLGWQEVLNEYIFKGDKRADDMLMRIFSGILYPIIHLGFGVEFEQPKASYLVKSKKAAKAYSPDRRSDTTIIQLLGEIYADMKRASGGRAKYTSQVHITEENLEEKTAEIINTATVKFDFWNIHAVNFSIFFYLFLRQLWLLIPNKIRLLKWKICINLAMYTSPRLSKLLLNKITNYKSKKDSSWEDIFKRVKTYHDNGYTYKLVRALINSE
ncbi:hypothetical protein K469DRAFT_724201 [Zopfia rhizophila CBS 207.26]|uniref:Uncharacterized protein n=1 Tax=Zopfia rhizophila CBS 207.26 TaxID=1314779 RepID=A0A6A6DBB1_9PEZI|nr:hypothetical protein K469DRAFT_724201 [Zopfia rhizophila CBS 207.26]